MVQLQLTSPGIRSITPLITRSISSAEEAIAWTCSLFRPVTRSICVTVSFPSSAAMTRMSVSGRVSSSKQQDTAPSPPPGDAHLLPDLRTGDAGVFDQRLHKLPIQARPVLPETCASPPLV